MNSGINYGGNTLRTAIYKGVCVFSARNSLKEENVRGSER